GTEPAGRGSPSDEADASLIRFLSVGQQRRDRIYSERSLTGDVCTGRRPKSTACHADHASTSQALDTPGQSHTVLEGRRLVCALESGAISAGNAAHCGWH